MSARLITVTLDLAELTTVLAESIATTLRARGVVLAGDVLDEVGRNTSQVLALMEEAPVRGRVITRPTVRLEHEPMRALVEADPLNVYRRDL